MSDDLEIEITEKVENNEYTLYDKVMYGGLGYGYLCLPANIFKILVSILFPPLGILVNNVGEVEPEFPYITLKNFENIIMKFDEFIISLLLTALFWVPGIIYTLSKLKQDKTKISNKKTKSSFTNTKKRITKNNNNNSSKKVMDLDVLKKRLDLD